MLWVTVMLLLLLEELEEERSKGLILVLEEALVGGSMPEWKKVGFLKLWQRGQRGRTRGTC